MSKSSNKVMSILFLVGGLVWLLAAIYNYQYEKKFVLDPIYYLPLGGYLWIGQKPAWVKILMSLLIVLAVLALLGNMSNWSFKLTLSPITLIIFSLLLSDDTLKKKGE